MYVLTCLDLIPDLMLYNAAVSTLQMMSWLEIKWAFLAFNVG